MSLMKALAKVAVGVAIAKGAQSMMRGGSGRGGLGGALNDILGGGSATRTGDSGGIGGSGTTTRPGTASGGGGLDDMLGSILGGARGGSGGLPGGLGGLLESLGGTRGMQGRSLQDILGGLAGAAGAGGILGGLAGSSGQEPARVDKSFGEVLNSQFDASPEAELEPTAQQEAAAALMLTAMIQAAKSDGKLDEKERQRILSQMGDVGPQDRAFVQAQLDAPINVPGLVAQVPDGMGAQVYTMAVLGIDLDTQPEAEYLHELAKGLGLKPDEINAIHAKLGVPALYA
ncbi:tellurite resistance TerB family protein [Sulfitobacter sp. LCG007]